MSLEKVRSNKSSPCNVDIGLLGGAVDLLSTLPTI